MTEFEQACLKEVARVREMLQQSETLNQFVFEVHASGRIHDGEVEITFGIGSYSASVTANSVNGAVREHLRRNGWEAANKPLALSYNGKLVDEIPF